MLKERRTLNSPFAIVLNSPEEEVYEYPSLSREGLREEGAYPVKAYKADRIDELPYQKGVNKA